MTLKSPSRPSRVNVGAHREQDLHLIQFWVPDVRAPAFRSEAHRRSLSVATSAQARVDQRFTDAILNC